MKRRRGAGVGIVSVGLDLGSTTVKAATLDEHGHLGRVASEPAPPLSGDGPTREGDPEAYLDTARRVLLEAAADTPPGTPLGIATQRSTLTLWDPRSGDCATPMISWQDRRAADWCASRGHLGAEVTRRTGLLLSPHYAGPKLGWLQSERPDLRDRLHAGDLLFGTTETLLAWKWSEGRAHETDLTVAARTGMVDLDDETWSDPLLESFDVPRQALPEIVDTAGRGVELAPGVELRAGVSDQASAALAVLDPSGRSVLVNLGTGGFVLVPVAGRDRREPGYLLGPILRTGDERRYVLEGTINGAGPALDRFGPGPTELPIRDASPAAFAVPDLAGLGAPYWRPDVGLTLSAPARELDPAGRRRTVLEGLVFRIRSILEQLSPSAPDRVILSGGLTRDLAVGDALAAVLGRDVELLLEPEAGLLGAARLAAGLEPFAAPATRTVVVPDARGGYLEEKFPAWREWLDTIL